MSYAWLFFLFLPVVQHCRDIRWLIIRISGMVLIFDTFEYFTSYLLQHTYILSMASASSNSHKKYSASVQEAIPVRNTESWQRLRGTVTRVAQSTGTPCRTTTHVQGLYLYSSFVNTLVPKQIASNVSRFDPSLTPLPALCFSSFDFLWFWMPWQY